MEIQLEIDLSVDGWLSTKFGVQKGFSECDTQTERLPMGHFYHVGHDLRVSDGVISVNVKFLDIVLPGPWKTRGATLALATFTFDEYRGRNVTVQSVRLQVLPAEEDLQALKAAYRR